MVEQVKEITRRLMPIGILLLILTISISIISYGRGWRVDLGKKSVKPTGLISATSEPSGAQVFIDGNLKTATNNAFNLDPGWYRVRIVKEGYLPWEKKLRVQAEVAVKTDALLFPTNPSLSPLTTSGVVAPTLSPDGTKVAYAAAPPGAAALVLWMLELSEGPLGRNRDPQQLSAADPILTAPDALLRWSPDSRELLLTRGSSAHLYTLTAPKTFTDVTPTLKILLEEWQVEQRSKNQSKLAGFPPEFIATTSSSTSILSFSPDETKVLYEATAAARLPIIIKPPLIGSNPTPESRDIGPGKLYIYDSKEDKNFLIGEKAVPAWFPTSNHLIISQSNKIDIMEYDGANRVTVYAGPFADGFLAPWPGGSRLVIVTNLNPGASTLPNLYTVNLR